ncbi:MAG TPA: hypothetical protein VH877_30435 [Polyangia bacterium]|jgi:hypothetical protein|nr:hypothetical protein [Polyangia bacterium]
MAKPPRPWIVTPHGPIEKLDDNLWAVDGEVPGMPALRRRMVMVRREDGTLIFFNAVPLTDDALGEIDRWGKPGWLILPNAYHKMDAHAFRERLGVKLLCDAAADAKVQALVPVDGHLEDLPADGAVRLAPLGGTKQGEVALVVTGPGGTSVVFGDAFMNMPKGSGFINDFLRFSGAPKCPPMFRLAFVRDKRALARDLEALAMLPGLRRLVPSHGTIVDQDPKGVLQGVIARDLG